MIYLLRRHRMAVVAAAWLLGMAAGGATLFWMLGREYGMASGEAASVSALIWQEDRPALEVHNLRVARGTRVTVKDLCSARAGDGSDLTDQIVLTDEKGKTAESPIDTGTPGVYSYAASVKNPANGREVKKTVLLLVDGGKVR